MAEHLTPYKMDKSEWGDGPWQKEPDRIEWEHRGLPCLMLRNPMGGNWCGYVACAPGSKFFAKDYSQCTLIPPCEDYCEHSPSSFLTVHGGLTYSGHCNGHICHVPKPGQPDNVWWLGFDCAHSGDYSPGFAARLKGILKESPDFLRENCNYKDVAYVKKQVEKLALQITNA